MSTFRSAVLISTLHPGQESAYDAEHARVPNDLFELLRSAGVRDWAIWRDGLTLLHLVDVDDYEAMGAQIAEHPVNVRWQAQMAAHVEKFHDVHTVPALKAPRLVWSMTEQESALKEDTL